MSVDPAVMEPASESTDPRVRRTREHVLNIARELLRERDAALTFSIVADRALVARQTLYKHWGTIENLIADTIVVSRSRDPQDYVGLDARARAEMFFQETVETLDQGKAAAIASILAASFYEESSAAAFYKLDMGLFELFSTSVGPVSHDQFIELMGPIILMTIGGGEVTRQMITSLAERAAQFIR